MRKKNHQRSTAILAAACLIGVMAGGCSTIKSLFGGPSASTPSQVVTETAPPPSAAPTAQSSIASDPAPAPDPAPASDAARIIRASTNAPPPPPAPAPPVDAYGQLRPEPSAPVQPSGREIPALSRVSFHDEGYDSDVSCDPTGRWIIFASTRHSAHANLFIQSLDTGAVSQITNDDADHANPVFSPDGKTIAFCSTRGAGNWEIDLADRSGQNIRCITRGDSQNLHPSFSPDGNRLVYCAQPRAGEPWSLWIADLQTGQCRMIGPGLFPAWSPNRNEACIAFQKAVPESSHHFSVWTMKLAGDAPCDVKLIAACANAAVVCPAWSPDGSRLAFVTVMEPAKSSAGAATVQAIWNSNADGSDRHCLSDGHGSAMTPFWGENRVFFISDRAGCDSVWALRSPEHSVSEMSASASGN